MAVTAVIKALLALERDRAGAGELEGADVELQRAVGADLDAVGGVEVVDDEGARTLEIDGAAVGLDLAGGSRC